ncbi:helix-hairpin-helix domain-containing protein [Anaerococcus sp. AGMB00486]|uniref:Helix-hairpin-helix domain-containing protein n=2 Tax=Anaerococcus TaxID=165779 RepID=A0ABX2N7G6_9FIRM|nr:MULTISPECIES: helix-hairpin-helix domain-containing protein [Anaerococcus]MDY3005473.1 helix-hairpin-helix domain-containing protein [Anaerococcus porci]MSS76901.1 competence protein ComEA [Anaerococcus porci]NVF10615.1 helix-hairpin-helix domain-containing protein [Anaerococcus faecalis]
MDNDKKDKIIIALAILIVLTLSYNFVNRKDNEELVINRNKDSISSLTNYKSNDNKDTFTTNSKSNDDSSIKVHISGEIKNPGVYTVNKNDRLDNLVKNAGGLSDDADINRINLALRLEDQMRIIIPNINDKKSDQEQINQADVLVTDANKNKHKVNINTADKATLMTLPNIGEKRALAIIEYREGNKFNKIEDIKNVSGIGDKYFEAMKDMIVVD